MRWPAPGDSSDDDTNNRPPTRQSWRDLADPAKWTHPSTWAWQSLTEPGTLLPALVFTATSLSAVRVYKAYLRRIPSVNHIKPAHFRKKSLFGKVTSVGDADNFRLFHTPGGWVAGWGWLPWKRVPTDVKEARGKTIHIRLAGIDAPELAHWGREAQPYSKEAHDWLTSYMLHRRVRAYMFKRDQYDRVVAQVFVRKWFMRKDVGYEMLKSGLATVYEAKSGSEYGDFEQKYRDAEAKARERNVGMWSKPGLLGRLSGEGGKVLESPREYKIRHAGKEKEVKGKGADKQKKAA